MNLNKSIAVFGESNTPPIGRGPEVVAYNLLKGLDLLGANYLNYCRGTLPAKIKAESEESKEPGDFNILVNGCLDRFFIDSPDNTLIGPCVEPVLGSYGYHENWINFVTASTWHKELFVKSYPEKSKGKNIFVWPAGIDTKKYKPQNKEPKYDCIIHAKHRDPNETGCMIEDLLSSFGQTVHPDPIVWMPVGFGGYTPEDMIERCNECRYSIILDCAETQGIANMEIMSMGLPSFVLDVNSHYNYSAVHSPFEATSVPYFSDECGMILHEKEYNLRYKDNHFGLDKYVVCDDEAGQQRTIEWQKDYIKERFQEFLKNLNNYNPRDYILREHTLEKSALNLIEIFEQHV
ncbi:hypothetical protein CL622_09060 [archaeon]|nr:hypothetical protein [archaeon]